MVKKGSGKMTTTSSSQLETKLLPPKGEFETFKDESHYVQKVKEWGLSTTKEVKKQFWYKDGSHQQLVQIKGYETYGISGEFNTIIIEFENGSQSCIHPAYLKEMQTASFGKTNSTMTSVEPLTSSNQKKAEISTSEQQELQTVEKEPAKQSENKQKAPKIDLPEEKVHFTAKIKQFALTWNNFNEENDEVIILEDVIINQDPNIEIGHAWCSYSKTLKKLELIEGEALDFNGKIVKKKLPKGKDVEEKYLVDIPVYFKINNPSKIKKS